MQIKNILLVGSGAREHAMCRALARSKTKSNIFCFMSNMNPGIGKLCQGYTVGNICDTKAVVTYALEKNIDLAIVGPEAPLEAGIVDELEKENIICASPRQKPAKIETDKLFARTLLEKYNIAGNVNFKICNTVDDVKTYFSNLNSPVVIKPIGLTGGKGVRIVSATITGQLKNNTEAENYAIEILEKSIGGHSQVLIEEKLEGEEFTLQIFSDGNTIIPMPLVQDHKFAFEGDKGPFTGGMGSYSDVSHKLPFISDNEIDQAIFILEKTIIAIKEETGSPYIGVLYGQFMLTRDGPKIIEFNARFGDPEAMNVLPLLESDFVSICDAMATGTLHEESIRFKKEATVCKYLVPAGYPDSPQKDRPLTFDPALPLSHVYYGSVNEKNGTIYTTSSRSIALLGTGNNISQAEESAQSSINKITGAIMFRKDIGTIGLIEKRIIHMNTLKKV